MRHNGPIKHQEILLRPDDVLVSRTTPDGHIVHANQRFIEISGFSHDELIDSPHNIVRHPDMPEAIFADMWETLQSNKPWSGLIKNRCKDGEFYWVQANVTPL